MALNLIKVTSKADGKAMFIGVGQIVAVMPSETGCTVILTSFPAPLELTDRATDIVARSNHRPPDGN